MKSYNGFTGAQRDNAQAWINRQIKAGLLALKPAQCSECGQTAGVLHYHSESYAKPYGGHITRYHLCYICHMLLHRRYSHPARWVAYLEMLKTGQRAQAGGWGMVCRFISGGDIPVEPIPAWEGDWQPASFLITLSLEEHFAEAPTQETPQPTISTTTPAE